MSRLSEKTLELTLCSQIACSLGARMVWFGLTQKEEARFGYDSRTRLGGRLIVLQFKASAAVNYKGERRFTLPHKQMTALQRFCGNRLNWVYYVFPLVGSRTELAANPDLLSQSWVLDVASLPNPIPSPTSKSGVLRKTGYHLAYVKPKTVRICSDEFVLPLHPAERVFSPQLSATLGKHIDRAEEGFWSALSSRDTPFTRTSVGGLIF
jgi:hypothetical protein